MKGKVEAVDEMLTSLDDCIHELQTGIPNMDRQIYSISMFSVKWSE